MIVPIKLPGIEEVLPNCVKTSGNGCYRSQIGIAEPDEKAGVFLPERLTRSDSGLTVFREVPSDVELNCAASHGYKHYAKDSADTYMAMDEGFGREDHCEGESEEPEVERPMAISHQPPLELMGAIPYYPCEETWSDQHREYLEENAEYILPESDFRGWVDPGNQSWNEQGGYGIYYYNIADGFREGSFEPVCNDACGSCCRADKADHRTFQENSDVSGRRGDYYCTYSACGKHLKDSCIEMPSFEF